MSGRDGRIDFAHTALDRREFLHFLGNGAVIGLAAGCGKRPAKGKPNQTSKRPEPTAAPTVEALREALLGASEADAMGVALHALRDGAERRDIWLAVSDALQVIDGDVHGPLALWAMHGVARGMPVSERLMPMLWGVWLLKQQQPAARPVPAIRPVSPAVRRMTEPQLLGALHHAFEQLQPDVVSECLRQLHVTAGETVTTEQLFILAARDDHFAGHATMLAVHGAAWLQRFQWHGAEALLDRIGRTLLPPATGQSAPPPASMETFRHARAEIRSWSKLPCFSLAAARLPKRPSAEVRAALSAHRSSGGHALRAAIGDGLQHGWTPADVWEALLVRALDYASLDRRTGRRGLHGFNTVHALHKASARAATEQVRALCLWMAAERLPSFAPSPSVSLSAEVTANADSLRDAKAPSAAKAPFDANVGRRRIVERADHDLHNVKFPAAIYAELATTSGPVLRRFRSELSAELHAAPPTRWPALDDARALLRDFRKP